MKALMLTFLMALTVLAPDMAVLAQLEINEEIYWAETMLMDAAIRTDAEGIAQARTRFERLATNAAAIKNPALAARVHYQIAFANFQLLYATYGQRPDSRELTDQALAHLDSAAQLQPSLAEAHALSALCSVYLSFLDRAQAESHRAQVTRKLEMALAVEPDNPRTYVAYTFGTIFSDGAVSREHARKAIELYEQQSPRDNHRLADWWQVTSYYYLSSLNYFLGEPEKMQEPVNKALELRPDFEAVISTQVPMLAPKTPANMHRFDSVRWQLLAEDPAADGRNPELADAKALRYFYDRKNDSLWFKIDFHRLPDPDAFGVNLMVDVDQNQATGMNWWGGNNKFTFDKLVTVWLRKGSDGRYYGPVGISSAEFARRQRLTKLGDRNVRFGMQAETKSIIFGFKRTDLDEARKLNIVAAVGSNVTWNDDLVDAGYQTLELK